MVCNLPHPLALLGRPQAHRVSVEHRLPGGSHARVQGARKEKTNFIMISHQDSEVI